MPEQPTPEQALGLVAQACAAFNGNLGQHQQLQAALKVIADVLKLKPMEAEAK